LGSLPACASKTKARTPFLRAASIDLESLLTILLQVEPLWAALRPALQNLTGFAVDFRYPGNEANKQDAKTAFGDCKSLRKGVRIALGLTV
jgi:hypothetical protein